MSTTIADDLADKAGHGEERKNRCMQSPLISANPDPAPICHLCQSALILPPYARCTRYTVPAFTHLNMPNNLCLTYAADADA